MATFSLHHIHHETADVDATVAFYQRNFQAELIERTVRDGVQWARVKFGDVSLNVTDRGEANALEKLHKKNLDLIVLNAPDAFGADRSSARLFDAEGKATRLTRVTKRAIAARIVSFAARRRKDRRP